MALHGYRASYWYHQIRWKPTSGEGPRITTILNYDGGDELRLRINVEGGKEEEMRTDGKLQDAITETKDRVERRCKRDGVTAKMQVTVSYHETETSMDTAEWEQAQLERDLGGESEVSEAEDPETDLRSWIRPGEIQRHHRAAKPVEEGPEASSRQLTPRGCGTGEKTSKGKDRHPGGMRLLALKHDEKMKIEKKKKVNVNVHFLIGDLPDELVQRASDPYTTIELSLQSLTLTECEPSEASTKPLREMVRQGANLAWNDKRQAAAETLQEKLRDGGVVLGVPCYDDEETRPFIIEADGGSVALER
ncbi:hypothetical protein CBR_g2670 [Chara braunii]|uniref:Uncharacterized protein n=1 Tax=Chara braunii TaxID=69332 RepID=A0A388KDJ9_CHABU|nr:hypothetical protein CBR_g2670 [Chara braunii]|eukprot:GBG68119.1 hypothetical protein CBR_g2670 [Chara braunii]